MPGKSARGSYAWHVPKPPRITRNCGWSCSTWRRKSIPTPRTAPRCCARLESRIYSSATSCSRGSRIARASSTRCWPRRCSSTRNSITPCCTDFLIVHEIPAIGTKSAIRLQAGSLPRACSDVRTSSARGLPLPRIRGRRARTSGGSSLNPNRTADLDYRRLVRDSRRIEESAQRPRIRIALLSDAATQQFVPVLKTLFSENALTAELYEAPFDAMELEVINPASGLYAFKRDVVLLIHSIQALRARYYEQGMSPEFDRMIRIWDALGANSAARIVQCNFALPYERPFGQFDQKLQQSLYAETRLLNARIAQAAGERANVLVCDIESIASYVGRKHWFDERLWDMSKTFCSLEFLPQA